MNVNEAIANGWQEVADPKLFSFERVGDKLIGELLSLQWENVKGDRVLAARMETPEGAQVKIFLPHNLREKIGRRHVGQVLMIAFDREDSSTAGKGNSLKIFRVLVAPDRNAEPPYVGTDADLPPGF